MPNLLLERFPTDVLDFVGPHLARVSLGRDALLHEPHRAAQHLYFPITSVLAVRHEAEAGHTMVVALVDLRGMAGASALLGPDATSTAVLVAGEAMRLETGHLLGEFERSAALRQCLLGWLQTMMIQAVQAASCLRFHSPEQRLCMRLAQLAHGRTEADILLTQEQLAELVGVRRELANELLRKLSTAGLVSQQRSRLALLDLAGITQRACACHGVVADALARATRGSR